MEKIKIFAFADEADNTLDGQIDAMLENRLNGVELRNVDSENVSDISPLKAKEIKSRLDDAGLLVWALGSPLGKIGIEDGDFISETEKLKRTLETAHLLGTDKIRIFSFYIPEHGNPADYTEAVIERLSIFCELSKKEDVLLCHENEKGIYGSSPENCLRLLTALPDLGCVFDPANFIQCGCDTLNAYNMLESHIDYLHIKDCDKNGDIVLPGEGIGNLSEIISRYLSSVGRAVTVEPHLKIFEGFSNLERENEKSVFKETAIFKDNRSAFSAACAALRKILDT